MFVGGFQAVRVVPRLEHAGWLLTLPQLGMHFEAIWFNCQRLANAELVGRIGLEQVKILENDGDSLSGKKGN